MTNFIYVEVCDLVQKLQETPFPGEISANSGNQLENNELKIIRNLKFLKVGKTPWSFGCSLNIIIITITRLDYSQKFIQQI